MNVECGVNCSGRGCEKKVIPLACLGEGMEARIVDYSGGKRLVQRLVEIGLHRDVVVRMVKCAGGPVLVQVHDSKVALGFGVAMKILVEKKDG